MAAVVLIVLTLAGCAVSLSPGWRSEVESLIGPVADWPAYRAHAQWRCHLDPAALDVALTREARGREWLAIQTDVRVLCPRRIQDLIAWEQSHGPVR